MRRTLSVLSGLLALATSASAQFEIDLTALPGGTTFNGSSTENIDFAEGFIMWRGLGIDYEFGVLEAPARVAIHYTHRLGALVAFGLLGFLGIRAMRGKNPDAIRRSGQLVIVALITQVSLGISVVWFGLPLFLATAHNGVAALLLLATINLNHAAVTFSSA